MTKTKDQKAPPGEPMIGSWLQYRKDLGVLLDQRVKTLQQLEELERDLDTRQAQYAGIVEQLRESSDQLEDMLKVLQLNGRGE